MSMVKLKNSTSRNAFDLSRRNAYTAKVGELLPVACIECIPGDKIKGRVQHFTRTIPVNTAAYTRIREYYDWFFVPTNLLWNKFNSFVTQMTNNSQHAASLYSTLKLGDTHPYLSTNQVASYINQMHAQLKTNMFGFSRAELSAKLLNYLGYGDFSKALVSTTGQYKYDANLNPFPLLAYQKIYQDYFRNSQWEDSAANTFNLDFMPSTNTSSYNINTSLLTSSEVINNDNLFDLKYCNWNKDLFMGVLPSAQYGASATIQAPTAESFQYVFNVSGQNTALASSSTLTTGGSITNIDGIDTRKLIDAGTKIATNVMSKEQLQQLQSSIANFSILALRQAEALQKWKEITQSQQQDYKAQIEAHFGVSMSDAYSERCKYVDGSVSNLDISEVTNTNITGDNASDIAGKGVGVGDGSINFESNVHGYLICIYHATPLLDYALTGINRTNLKTTATDYAIPEFDRTGMVSVPVVELTNSSNLSINFEHLGYAPRYYEYKQAYDEVHGAFRNTLGSWVAPVSDNYLTTYLNGRTALSLDYKFFKVNPATLNPIFAVEADSSVDTDQLLINASFDITAVRNLDRNGLPY